MMWDTMLAPFVYPAGWVLRKVRWLGLGNMPRCKRALLQMGVFPIVDHYTEPQFDFRRGTPRDRRLRSVDLDVAGQLAFLTRLSRADECKRLADEVAGLNASAFGPGDAECWYQVIRELRPRRIIEIGSGHSTRIARAALRRNREDNPDEECEHICIEPYEAPWLESLGVRVLRRKVEDVGSELFERLEANDILFIDSSHMVRPGGDVLCEYLDILPSLRPGVVVHVHDIYTPRDYPRNVLDHDVLFWNEQYVLEAFLVHNHAWKVIAALNLLRHEHFEALRRVAPLLETRHEPGSFYMRKVA